MRCKQCGRQLQVLTSVASDPHDEPVYHCSCWPTDWQLVGLQVVIVVGLAAVFCLLSLLLRWVT